MARPSPLDSNQPDSSVERLALAGTAPRPPLDSDSIHRPAIPGHQVEDLEKSSTTYRQDSGHWVQRVSSPPTLYRREEPVPPEDGTLAQPRIHLMGSPLSQAEVPASVSAAGSRIKLSFERVSLDIPRQGCLNNLHFLSGDDRVRRVENDLIIRLEAGDNLYLISEVVSGRHGREHDFVVLHNADA